MKKPHDSNVLLGDVAYGDTPAARFGVRGQRGVDDLLTPGDGLAVRAPGAAAGHLAILGAMVRNSKTLTRKVYVFMLAGPVPGPHRRRNAPAAPLPASEGALPIARHRISFEMSRNANLGLNSGRR